MTKVKSIMPNEPADFTPEVGNYKLLEPFRYWCHKVLPLVYDDSLSYYELLCKVVDYLNKTMDDVDTLHGDVTNLHTAYEELQSYVNNYFSTLDVQVEINNKLDNMAESGELYEIIRRYTDPIINEQNEKIDDSINEQNEKINVLETRMNTFTSLPNGSTSGDAELQDIRVGYNGVAYPNAGDAVREQIGELNEDLDKHEEYFETIAEPSTYVNLLDNINITEGYYMHMDGSIIPAEGNYITDYIPFTNEQTIHFYDGTNNQLIRWGLYDNNKTWVRGYFFYLNENGEADFNWTDVTHSYLRFSFEQPTPKINYGTEKEIKSYGIKKSAIPKNVMVYDYVVSKDESGDFTSVTEACNVAKDGESIYIKSGVYDNEVIVGTWSKKLYLVGESANDTIIKNSLGDYNRPPIQIGSGYLKNLTFYSEYTGTQERGTGATMSYAVHSESNNLANGNLTIEDCILISDYAPSFGLGMRGGCNVTLKNCYLKGTYSGALLFHDADNVSYVGEQNISVIDCVLYDTNNTYCVIMQSQERQGTIVNLEMIRNRLKTNNAKTYSTHNYYGGTGGANDFLGLINFRLKETSWGNSDNTFDN